MSAESCQQFEADLADYRSAARQGEAIGSLHARAVALAIHADDCDCCRERLAEATAEAAASQIARIEDVAVAKLERGLATRFRSQGAMVRERRRASAATRLRERLGRSISARLAEFSVPIISGEVGVAWMGSSIEFVAAERLGAYAGRTGPATGVYPFESAALRAGGWLPEARVVWQDARVWVELVPDKRVSGERRTPVFSVYSVDGVLVDSPEQPPQEEYSVVRVLLWQAEDDEAIGSELAIPLDGFVWFRP
ncbi:MAG: hypothetical protein FD171_2158 [Actinobacteria bacterium]|nr:MAG: hypothetical protein FD171_2158 [Actinomycetota bacterium]